MKQFLVCAMLCALAACGSEKPEETVFDPMVEQLDRVQQQADSLPQQRKADLDRAVEGDSQ